MQGYQARHFQSSFESFTLQQISRSKNMHVDSLATLATSSTQALPRLILVEELYKPIEVRREMVQIHRLGLGLIGWIPQFYSLGKVPYLGRRERQIKYEGKLLVFGCPRNKSCTNVRFLDSTSYVSILKQWSHSQRSYMREFVEVMQVVDHYFTGSSPRGIGGQIYRKRHRNL